MKTASQRSAVSGQPLKPDPDFVAGRRLGGISDAAAAFGRPVRTVQKWLYAGKFSKTNTGQFHWPTVLVQVGVPRELVRTEGEAK